MAYDSWPSPAHNSGAVTEPEYESLLVPYTGSGVYGTATDTAVVYGDSSGRQVKVRANKYGLIRGFFWTTGTSETIESIAANSSGSTRTDLVVMRLDRSTWTARPAIKQGTPGAGAPALTQTFGASGLYEMVLAVVTVTNGAATITAGNVVARDVYLERPPLAGSYANMQALTGMMVGQEFRVYDSTSPTVVSFWWNGTIWSPTQTVLCQLRQASGQVIANNTTTALTWDTEDVDTHNGHSTSSNTSRYVAPYAGWYEVSGAIYWDAVGNGRRIATWFKNGTAVNGGETAGVNSGSQSICYDARTMLIQLAVGDYVELRGYQESGGTLSTLASGGTQSHMTIRLVG